MARRPRRSGIKFIKDDKNRYLTYFKRRAGVYRSAANLCTLTGAKVAIVLESESGTKSAFGTPSADPIDSLLSQDTPTNLYVNEGEKPRITRLQDELLRLKKDKEVEDKKVRDSNAHIKEIQDSSKMANLLCSNVEDLGGDELSELFQSLTLLHQDIDNRLHPDQLEDGGRGDPSLELSFSSSHSQIEMPPRRLPWAPLQPSSQLPQSSWAPLSQSSLLRPTMQPSSAQAPPAPLLQHQEHMMLPQLFPHEFPPLPSSQPLPLPVQVQLPVNPVAPPGQNHAYSQNFSFRPVSPPQDHANTQNCTAGQPSASYQWPPVTPSNEPHFDTSFHAPSDHLGLADDNGGHDMPGPSGLPQPTGSP